MGFNTAMRLLVFVIWAVTSFLCHFCAKTYLKGVNPSHAGLGPASLVTLLQVVMCYCLTSVRVPDGHRDSKMSTRLFFLKVTTHVLATLATNYSLAHMHAASTLAIKMMEPLTSAIAQYMTMSVPLRLTTVASLALLVPGAITFVGNPLSEPSLGQGTLLAMASNLLLAVRNVTIKLEYAQHSDIEPVQLRKPRILAMVLFGSLVFVVIAHRNSHSAFTATMLVGSGLFHVFYSVVSTGIVLQYLTVVGHAIGNIFKRIVVVLLLYAVGQRTASMWNFLGLLVSTLGLTVYAVDSVKRRSEIPLRSFLCCRLVVLSALLLSVTALLIAIFTNLGPTFSPFTSPPRDPVAIGASFRRNFRDAFSSSRLDYLDRYHGNLTAGQLRGVLATDLVQHPDIAPMISLSLQTSRDIVEEAQRIHFNIFSRLLAGYKYAFLLDLAAFENKGDPAISLGEMYLLRRLGIEVIYTCNFYACVSKNLKYALNISRQYSVKELVILIHGGGNLVCYRANDLLRQTFFSLFQHFQMILFPQGICILSNAKGRAHFQFCRKIYSVQGNFTMILRDRYSLEVAREHFAGKPRFLLSPDMAFQIGLVPRFLSPVYDILWLRREDSESPHYTLPTLPDDLSITVSDWWKWRSPTGKTSMETAEMIATNGFLFLQRARVVISDRLHGHILCILLNIPHVLIDNRMDKLKHYLHTWTKGSDITVLAQNATDALYWARKLLKRFGGSLPPIVPFMKALEYAPTEPTSKILPPEIQQRNPGKSTVVSVKAPADRTVPLTPRQFPRKVQGRGTEQP